MKFKEQHFAGCLHNPLTEDFYYASERLQEIAPESRMMAYIIMVYDPRSPLRKEYPELITRKKEAMEISEYSLPDEEDEDPFDIYDCVIDYLKMVNNRLWSSIVAIESTIWEMTEKLLKPVELVGAGQDKDRLAAVNMKPATALSLVELNNTLDGLIMKFYESDTQLIDAASKKPMNYSAEAIAKALKGK